MSSHSSRSSHRKALLDATEAMITEGKVSELTLEAVAGRAGVTRGGLIYHFKTREALLHALVERMIEDVDVYGGEIPADPAQALEKFLTARIHYAFAIDARQKSVMANLLAATATYPSLLEPVRRMYNRGAGDMAQVAGSAGLTLSVWTALDGMVMLEMLNIRQFSDSERTQMRDTLLELVRRQFADSIQR